MLAKLNENVPGFPAALWRKLGTFGDRDTGETKTQHPNNQETWCISLNCSFIRDILQTERVWKTILELETMENVNFVHGWEDY